MHDGNGVAFRDVNGDNMPDLYLICLRGENRLLINSGAYRPFKDMTAISGLSGNPRPGGVFELDSTIYDLKLGTTLFDSDNDNDCDIFITGWRISTSLYRNDGNLNFQNVTNRLDIFPPIDANGCAAADINNDGLLDVFISDEHYSNRMLLNIGDNYFQDVTTQCGLEFTGISKSGRFCDVDNDGDQDLYVTNWGHPDFFYRNLGDGKYIKMNLPIDLCQKEINTNSVNFGDIDNDGDFDLFVTSNSGFNQLFVNATIAGDSNWVFEPNDFISGGKSYGSVLADFNNDGWIDIFITKVGLNTLLLNCRDGSFKKLMAEPEGTIGHSTGAACADFDLDGDLDLFVANKDTLCVFYQNFTNDSSYIKFKLNGIRSNSDAVGTRISIYRAGGLNDIEKLLGTREICAGAGYFSQSDLVVHFGLDTIKIIDVNIRFPSGKEIIETNLSAAQTYEIDEYSFIKRTTILAMQYMLSLMRQSEFWYGVFLTLLFLALTFILIRLGLKRYRWSSGTASGYLVGFFLMALIAIIALKKLGLLYIFATIDVLTIIFVTTFIINSERLYRLRKIRERYRSVLIDLSNQIVNIHDDEKLCKTVVENIHKITEFDTISILSLNQEENAFKNVISRGIDITLKDLNSQEEFPHFVVALKKQKYLQRSSDKKFENFFSGVNSNFFLAIERDKRLYSVLSLGAFGPVPPLSKEDIDLFTSITNQMAIALENNEYIRKSTEMIKKLTEAEVREKYLKELEATNAILDTKNRDLQKLYDELKNTQAQLIHSEKMASLGQLVAGISHELNNPIGFIYSNIKQLKTYTGKIETFIEDLGNQKSNLRDEKEKRAGLIKAQTIERILPDIKNLINDTISGSQMIKELVENLRRFSHLDQAKWKSFDIHEGIESSIKILLPQFKERVEIHRDYKADGLVECNPGQMNQVFLNLLANAAQAIEKEGNIWIVTENGPDNIIIRIKDDGKGMSPEILSKIFDPFFTTKDVGEGTGLGLSISYSIIQNHGGTIEAESDGSSGSLFVLNLPRK
jgi:signal transduction histidine kinase